MVGRKTEDGSEQVVRWLPAAVLSRRAVSAGGNVLSACSGVMATGPMQVVS